MRNNEQGITYKDGQFFMNGTKIKLWFVGGSGALYTGYNVCLIDGEAFKEIVKLWVDTRP